MRRAHAAFILALGLTLPAASQAPGTSPYTPEQRSQALRMMEQRAFWESGRHASAGSAAAERRQSEFNSRLIEFTTEWNHLIQSSEHGEWNAKAARKTREAFERLARSEGWIESPAPGSKRSSH